MLVCCIALSPALNFESTFMDSRARGGRGMRACIGPTDSPPSGIHRCSRHPVGNRSGLSGRYVRQKRSSRSTSASARLQKCYQVAAPGPAVEWGWRRRRGSHMASYGAAAYLSHRRTQTRVQKLNRSLSLSLSVSPRGSPPPGGGAHSATRGGPGRKAAKQATVQRNMALNWAVRQPGP